MHEIHIGWMYPDLLNLHGERGSVEAFRRVGENLGLEVCIHRFDAFDEPIPFETLDALIFLPGEIHSFQWLKPALEKQRPALESYIENDGVILALGTTGLLFGKSVLREDGTTVEGLGLLDMTAKERQYVWGDDLHFRINATKQEIFGSQILMADVDAKNPLGTVLYGKGNHDGCGEGARYRNLMYTNCLGPLFVKNPWWAEDILKDICLRKFLKLGQKKPHQIALDSFESGMRFLERKQKQG